MSIRSDQQTTAVNDDGKPEEATSSTCMRRLQRHPSTRAARRRSALRLSTIGSSGKVQSAIANSIQPGGCWDPGARVITTPPAAATSQTCFLPSSTPRARADRVHSVDTVAAATRWRPSGAAPGATPDSPFPACDRASRTRSRASGGLPSADHLEAEEFTVRERSSRMNRSVAESRGSLSIYVSYYRSYIV